MKANAFCRLVNKSGRYYLGKDVFKSFVKFTDAELYFLVFPEEQIRQLTINNQEK